ncbi:MAG: flagellar basal body P-ring formation chaperone FlgA [Alphaproteobacteria bacterium]
MTRSISLVGKTSGIKALWMVFVAIFSIGQTAYAQGTNPIFGRDINVLVAKELEAQGLQGEPKVSSARKFVNCGKALSVAPMFGSWKTVKVNCPGSAGWTLVVRTILKSTVKTTKKPEKTPRDLASANKRVLNQKTPSTTRSQTPKMIQVLALGRSVSRDDVIMPQDVIVLSVPENSVSGFFTQANHIVGRKLKSRLSAGKPVQSRHLHPLWMVEENDEVLIQNDAGGISVNMVGIALENGQFGEWIKVQNASSGVIVVGQIKNNKIISTNAKISN